MSRIDLVNINKKFGSYEAIADLSLAIDSGEFVVFLGPSGCGKTTLLRMIAGLEAVTAGEIHIGDRRVEHLPPGQRGVAMVFQSYALYPHMTVAQNMAFGLRNIGTEKSVIEAKIAEAARILQLETLLDRKPGQLSGGQRQRVAIGRAIVKSPEVFLFDEPLSNLDAMLRARTRVEIARLHQTLGATMVFVTHDQIEAMTMAQKIVVMSNGKIEQVGAPLDIYRRPATRFVASFVGVPAMNFLDVSNTEAVRGKLHVRVGETMIPTGVPAAGLSGPLTLGIRPEALRVDANGTIAAKVDVVERLGDKTIIHAMLPGGQAVVGEDGDTSALTFGDQVRFSVDSARTHVFDAAGRGHHAEVAP
ncbi:ABC transporter ATP-binding protein [Devosia sp. Root685]|uniref:ABC transporter ATP-binding protein n=1 Tax=Devosia sp. Root685 TaxID=1736587 RepID=UPI0006FCB5A4|nr:sn-glycerol-3-phosphate ABC transporter ATP-binding protein UgpC [Devosia sp. Root685]KRA99823.1 ABC transporter ATP-binding protein [Devosia sp. Root685]